MKNIAKLTLFFTFSFVILFLCSGLSRLLSSWIDLARIIPIETRQGGDITEIARKAFPLALYLCVLLSLSYTIRLKIPTPFAIICVFVLGCAFSTAVSLGLNRWEVLKPALKPVPSVRAEPGLILSRSDNATVLLKESSDIRGPRVVSIPGRSLIYQEVPLGPNNTILNLPALPFAYDIPWFIRSLDIDFTLSAGEMAGRFEDSFRAFAVYTFSLVLLLCSLCFLLKLSQWPLANIFLSALAFRLILSLETFLNTKEINTLIAVFLNDKIPVDFITPLVFTALAVLFMLYTLLSRAAHAKGKAEDD